MIGQTPENSKSVIADYVSVANRGMSWSDEAFTNPQKVLSAVNPQMAQVDITKTYDKSFLQKLADMGFYQKIGDPELPK